MQSVRREREERDREDTQADERTLAGVLDVRVDGALRASQRVDDARTRPVGVGVVAVGVGGVARVLETRLGSLVPVVAVGAVDDAARGGVAVATAVVVTVANSDRLGFDRETVG